MSHIRRTSAQRAKQLREYSAMLRELLATQPLCEACHVIRPDARAHAATEVHHKRGRIGSLLCDGRHWLLVCRTAHHWIHDNPRAAVEAGFIDALHWNATVRTQHRRRTD